MLAMNYAPGNDLALRIVTSTDVKYGKAIATTIAPQVHVTDDVNLCVTIITQDSCEPLPVFHSFVIDHRILYEHSEQLRQQQPSFQSELYNQSPLANMYNRAQAVVNNRTAYAHAQQVMEAQRDRLLHLAQQTEQRTSQQPAPQSAQQPGSPAVSAPAVSGPSDSYAPVYCGMMSADLGPLSGTVYNSSLNPVDVNDVQGRRPNRAEHFRKQDREHERPNQPQPYFYRPQSRIGNSSFVITFACLSQMVRNPKFAPL
jgi:hypothetical protein